MAETRRIAVIGAGPAGLAAAYELVRCGAAPVVFEAEEDYGGLLGTAAVGAGRVEKFYHHLFTGDAEAIGLIDELGLSSKLRWSSPRNAIFVGGRLQRLSSPIDLLGLEGLRLGERMALAAFLFRVRLVGDWRRLDAVTARGWVERSAGSAVYERIWSPLLRAKFGDDADGISAAWLWSRIRQRSSSRSWHLGAERLGYMEGSFATLYDALADRIVAGGGEIRCGHRVDRIAAAVGVVEVETRSGAETFDGAVATVAPPVLAQMVGASAPAYAEALRGVRYKANVCLMLVLDRPLSPYYWTSIAERDFPFVAVIEQTKLVSAERYDGHVVYVSAYVDRQDATWRMEDGQVAELFLGRLGGVFEGFRRESVREFRVYRAAYAQPVALAGYAKAVPSIRTALPNVVAASMAQVYPEDRGQNHAVRLGREAARMLASFGEAAG